MADMIPASGVFVPPAASGRKLGHVLVVSHLFPPIGGGGVQRALKWAKYLPTEGWIPHVLTGHPDDSPWLPQDPDLLAELSDDAVPVIRARTTHWVDALLRKTRSNTATTDPETQVSTSGVHRRILRRFSQPVKDALLVPDEQVFWRRSAIQQALEHMRSNPVQAILSTSGPATNHLVARELGRITGLPWIADFRDPWTENMHADNWSSLRKWREMRMERAVIQSATVLSTVTRSFAHSLVERYPKGPAVALIYNGFDPDDYRDIQPVHQTAVSLVYAGILYPKRSPATLLRAFHELIQQASVTAEDLRLVFAGTFDYPGQTVHRSMVDELGLQTVVDTPGHLPHRAALQLMAGADGLLMIGDDDARAGDYIPGKLYEYLALGKPVLGTLHCGEARDILEQTGHAFLAEPGDVPGMMHQILRFFEQQGQPSNRDQLQVQPFQRNYQAKQMAWLLESITGNHP